MTPLLFLFFLLSEAACDLQVVTVHPGDDVILPCLAADSSISVVEWSRADLEPDYVLLTIDGHLKPNQQHPSFKDRVDLVDRDLKDGNVSLILKNVNINDIGTYECRVKPDDSRRKKRAIINSEPIRTIRLQVTDPDLIVVLAGQDATLPCWAADSSIRAVEWTRPDLEPEYVLFYSDGYLETDEQNPDFKDRVDLVDRDLKDGDMSLTLKNVSSIDNGTYECRVASADFRRKKRANIDSEPIRIIRLQVPEPAGSNSGSSMDENSMNAVPEDRNSSPVGRYRGLAAGVAGGLFLLAVAVVGVLIYRRPNTPSVPPTTTDEAPATTLV
ncbi:coxsackievirus and adenovirus receptor-like [Perca flavescens]|uniref:coxsackievirus and adenovirus receptor-like n=1 Tax=Perca flavescens TaxID=8167 RepID=UPI00106E192A|nr:coxsackievirus and adenovirus receptor-like [Perca flavescens]